ncbi:hypothetical protein GCM10009104_32110 [Marinobacterium maritimum]|uniref:Uncharacterized protein n=1 Tax=Marinobacterium maritimum TaxID=500162 RepID=A0ABN1I9V3_9GAMM
MTALKALGIWLIILVVAVANGILRESVLMPMLGLTAGLILSGMLLSVLILVITFFTLPWLQANRRSKLAGIGLFWLLLTLVFEFAFGWSQGKPLSVILDAYTFKDGNLWPVVLLVTVTSPYVAARLREICLPEH